MIELEITSVTDINRLGPYTFYKDNISFGSDQYDELLNTDKGILKNHSTLFIEANKLYIQPNENIEFFHVNGKRTTAIKSIKSNDIIKIGETVFKILSYSAEIDIQRKKFLNDKVSQLKNEQSDLIQILQHLDNDES